MHKIVIAFSAAVLLLFASHVCAAPKVVWAIGKVDKSGKEFGLFGKYEDYSKKFPNAVLFQVGKSSAAEWPYILPGVGDAWAGSVPHTARVDFELSNIPAGDCELVVHTVAVYTAVRKLSVRINGEEATLALMGNRDEGVLKDESKRAPQKYFLRFKPSLLRTGNNEVAFINRDASWLLFDEIHLQTDDAKSEPVVAVDSIEPSLCWLKTANGAVPTMLVSVRNMAPARPARVTVQAGSKTNRQRMMLHFGETKLELPVPAEQERVQFKIEAADASVTTRTEFATPAKWRVYLVPSIHTDIGYTDLVPAVFHRHNVNLDNVLDMLGHNSLLKWNVEVAWEVVNYLKDRPAEAQHKLLSNMQKGRLGLLAGYLNFLTALMSDEAMNRYAQYAAELHRKYGINYSAAVMSDNPTVTWGLCSTMAASGIKYFAEGINQDRGPVLNNSGIFAPFYWEGPDGSRVLTYLSPGYARSRWMAEAPSVDDLQRSIGELLKRYVRPDYPFDAVYVYGAFGDNRPVNTQYAALLKEWERKYAYPKLMIGDGSDFFKYLEQKYAKTLQVRRGDFGAFWEDGAGSSAQETAMHMENQRRLARIETMWAMAGPKARDAYPREAAAKAWDDVQFYSEHTWGAGQSIRQPDDPMTIDQWTSKSEFAHRPYVETAKLESGALQAVAAEAGAKQEQVVVVNTLSQKRSGLVELPGAGADAQFVDAQGNRIPVQLVSGKPVAFVKDVPGFGCTTIGKSAEITPAADQRQPDAFENGFYRIALDPDKGVASITDKQTGRELVDASSPYQFGQIVYVSGGEGTRIMQHTEKKKAKVRLNTGDDDSMNPPKETLLLTPAKVTEARIVDSGPVFTEAVIRSSAPSMPQIETHVRLSNVEKRISFDVQITSKTEIRKKEAVYVCFPFAVESPKFRLGMTGCVSDPKEDFVHGACHDWYCAQDFVACENAKTGEDVVWSSLDAPLLTLGEVNSGKWQADYTTTNSTILSYAMNNYWHTNYKAGQGGDFRFRYELTSGKNLSNTAMLHFARSAANPLLAATGTGQPAGHLLAPVVDSDAVVGFMKPAEEGRGTILRLRNAETKPVKAGVQIPENPNARFKTTTLTEDNPKSVSASRGKCAVQLKPQQTLTLLVE